MTAPGGAGTLRRHCNFSRARPTGFSHKVGALGLQGTAPLSQIETFVTFCGIVWLRAKVLGRMGWTTSPYLRACALSCPSLAIDGPGSYGAPAFRFAASGHPDPLSTPPPISGFFPYNTRRQDHPSSGALGPIGPRLCAIHPSAWNRNSA